MNRALGPRSAFQEEFSRAYAQAILSTAHCGLGRLSPDVHGVDLSVQATLEPRDGLPTFSALDVQLKSSYQDLIGKDHINYSLSRRHYDALRTHNVTIPRILLVVLVPREIEEWIEISESELQMRKCAYWMSLRGLPDRSENAITVKVPRSNIFDVAAVMNLLEKARSGQAL